MPTYLLDKKRNIKLYPCKSNNLITTSINTQFHVNKNLVDYTLGFTISMDIYYNPDTHNLTKYNAVAGRGNNTGFHSGLYTPGLILSNWFGGNWRSQSVFSLISKTGLTADKYRLSLIVTPTNYYITLLNLRTNVLLTGNTEAVGTTSNGDNLDFTFLSYGIDGHTGAYGSVGLNISRIVITRNNNCILYVPLSNGADIKAMDICNKTSYNLGFFTASSGWGKNDDYHHANFYYGFTLYQKSGSLDLFICNAMDGTEITITPPSGYTKIGNYKNCKEQFNGCESKFKLDDVTASPLYLADIDRILFDANGTAKEFDINDLKVDSGFNRGYMYINKDKLSDFLFYTTDKTLYNDIEVIKFVRLLSKVVKTGDEYTFDANNHAVLSYL